MHVMEMGCSQMDMYSYKLQHSAAAFMEQLRLASVLTNFPLFLLCIMGLVCESDCRWSISQHQQ